MMPNGVWNLPIELNNKRSGLTCRYYRQHLSAVCRRHLMLEAHELNGEKEKLPINSMNNLSMKILSDGLKNRKNSILMFSYMENLSGMTWLNTSGKNLMDSV